MAEATTKQIEQLLAVQKQQAADIKQIANQQTTGKLEVSQSNTPPPAASPGTPLLVDGAAIALILASVGGIFKMLLPTMTDTWRKSSESRMASFSEERSSQLRIEESTASALQSALANQQASLLENNNVMVRGIVDDFAGAMRSLNKSQSEVSAQVLIVTECQQTIAKTQLETARLLREIKFDLAELKAYVGPAFGRRADDKARKAELKTWDTLS